LRKNAPRTDNRKRRINSLNGRDKIDLYALKIETELQLGNCSGNPHKFRVKAK